MDPISQSDLNNLTGTDRRQVQRDLKVAEAILQAPADSTGREMLSNVMNDIGHVVEKNRSYDSSTSSDDDIINQLANSIMADQSSDVSNGTGASNSIFDPSFGNYGSGIGNNAWNGARQNNANMFDHIANALSASNGSGSASGTPQYRIADILANGTSSTASGQVGSETGDRLNKISSAISSGDTSELQRQASAIANDGGNSDAVRAAAERLHTDSIAGKPAWALNRDLRKLEDTTGLRANGGITSGKPHGDETSNQVERAGRSILDNNWEDVGNQMDKIASDPANSDELKNAGKQLKQHLSQNKDAGTLIADLQNVKKAAGFTK